MNIDPKRAALAVLATAALAACAVDPHTGAIVPPPHELGEASHQTLMAQVVDPDPHYNDGVQATGVEVERAIQAYREGTVTEPQAPAPTAGVSGGGSGMSSGGTR